MQTFKIAIAGIGTVGANLVKIINHKRAHLAETAGKVIEITAISSRSKENTQNRGVDINKYQWFDDPYQLSGTDADLIVELIGGDGNPAYTIAKNSLNKGKHFVSANKALLSQKGYELAALAQQNNAYIGYEAAVCGGLPVIKALSEGFMANRCQSLRGILNGTCNFILTIMEKDKISFEDALKLAQEKGYAEADPTFDIDGIDTAHKLSILSSIAFGIKPSLENTAIEGIRDISLEDIMYARELGYSIKLLGVAKSHPDGKIEQRIHPVMVRSSEAIANCGGVLNSVSIIGDLVGEWYLQGAGAGGEATASAVASDIVNIAAGNKPLLFGHLPEFLRDCEFMPISEVESSYYISLYVKDIHGVLRDITAILAKYEISVESLLQRGKNAGEDVVLALITHKVKENNMNLALAEIAKLKFVVAKPHRIRIEGNNE